MITRELSLKITEKRTKKNLNQLIEKVLNEGLDWDQYFPTFISLNFPEKWHLTWWLGHYVKADPAPVESRQMLLWETLFPIEHQAINRDLWRILTHLDLNEELVGIVFDEAMKVIPSQKHPAAERAYAMEVVKNITLRIPELKHEVELVFQSLSLEEPASIRARKRMFLKKLQKLKS